MAAHKTMERREKPTDISSLPEVMRLAEEVQQTRQAQLLKRGDEELAILAPAPSRRRRSARRAPIPRTDSLFKIVGLASSEGPTDVSERTDDYLAQAYYEEFHPSQEP